MTETNFTNAELDAAIAAREAEKATTRELSPRKPDDHKPALATARTVEFNGEKYEFDVRAAKDTRTMFALRRDDFETVLTRVIGADGMARAIESLEDGDGYADFEKLAELVQVIYEKAGAKN